MKILGVDTSSSVCAVGIFENEKLLRENVLDNGRTHSENLMPLIEKTLNDADLNLDDIDCIAVVVGPGSFTGIRIGVASCKAMAEFKNIKIIPIISLESLAANEYGRHGIICSMIDAKNDQIFCGVFDENLKKVEEYMADDINSVLEKLTKYDNIIFVGNGSNVHKESINNFFKEKDIAFSDNNTQNAKSLGIIANKKVLKCEFVSADELIPVYLRKSQAERMRDEKQNSKNV